ncbi:MAG: nascent polypeptide-associated complex protein [Promethearchaeota archaeon]
MVKVKKARSKRRSMERQMRKSGIDFQQLEGVTEVLIRFPDKELVLTSPQVMMMRAQGESVYQIIGESTERAPTEAAEVGDVEEPIVEPQFTEEDVQLVASQANVSEEEARNALREAGGNLAKAIISLTGG